MADKRLIDANWLMELYDMGNELEEYAGVLSVPIPVIRQNIKDAPTVDAVPVVHGRWAWDTEDIYKCTNCGEKSHVKEVMGKPDWNYCPHCGADMRGGEEDGC